MDWKAALEEILAERRQQLGERPSEDDLLALRAGELTDEERERLLEQAAVDPEVARELFDVLRFPEAGDDDGTEEDVEENSVDERWQAFRQRLVDEGELPARQRSRKTPVWLPLAATFVLGVSAALLVGRLLAPADARVNLAIVELLPLDNRVSRGAVPVTLDDETGGVVLTLAVPDVLDDAPFTLEITRDDEVRTIEGLRPGVGGVFVLELPRSDLDEGLYEMRLLDNGGAFRARFQLEVELRQR